MSLSGKRRADLKVQEASPALPSSRVSELGLTVSHRPQRLSVSDGYVSQLLTQEVAPQSRQRFRCGVIKFLVQSDRCARGLWTAEGWRWYWKWFSCQKTSEVCAGHHTDLQQLL